MFLKQLLILLTMLSAFIPYAAHADRQWYVGQVSRVALIDGNDSSFIVSFKNGALDDCQYKYAYFYGGMIGQERLKSAYALAITSLTTGLDMGVVIDKAVNGAGGQCNATGMAADLRAR